jgi:hypothetical protein
MKKEYQTLLCVPAKQRSSHRRRMSEMEVKQLTLKRLNIGCLPTFRPLNYIELHRLPLLQALEAARVDRRVMGENVFAVLTADEPKSLGIVKPLHCSLFHLVFLNFSSVAMRC